MYYINETFLEKEKNAEPDSTLLMIIGAALVYPTFYDGMQAVKQGVEYLSDMWNYLDILHIVLGYVNIYF
jgi:hypothetical protein